MDVEAFGLEKKHVQTEQVHTMLMQRRDPTSADEERKE